MTETTLEENFTAGSYNILANDALSDHLMSVLERLGPIEFTDDEIAYAKQIASAFPIELRQDLLKQDKVPTGYMDAGLTAEDWPIADRGEVPPGSTDVSDVSWITPTAQLTTPTWALGVPGRSWAVTATGAMSIGHKGMMHAAKAMVIAAAEAVLDPSIVERAKAEFASLTRGRPYACPIPANVMPRRP